MPFFISFHTSLVHLQHLNLKMASNHKQFIIDFDSTFTQVEALDLLAEISLDKSKSKDSTIAKIKALTDKGMEGKLSLRSSLNQRLELLDANQTHLDQLVKKLKKEVSISFKRNGDFFKKHRDHIYIVSNGFKEFIVPIVEAYGVKPDHVYANTFKFDKNGKIKGLDTKNVLSTDNGKVKLIRKLDLKGEVFVIGDGYTDYEVKEAGLANKFFAFTENISRENILKDADHVAPSLDEFLYLNKMNTSLSYPKNRIKVLLLEDVHSLAFDILKKEGYMVEEIKESLSEKELQEKIKDVSILGIRSKTQVTAKVLRSANRLLAIGAYCIGTNQIDLQQCTAKGIAVFNAPFSNTRSVVELVIAEIITLMRNVHDKSRAMHTGKWQKTSAGNREIRGKKLGIVGYGNIGSQLSVLAESLGMDVYYYDIEEKLALGNATKIETLRKLLATADVVTLHVDGRKENADLIGAKEIRAMKKGSILINLSRGHVVNVEALREGIESGKLSGAAIDVFPNEPHSNNKRFVSVLRGLPNVILTPHIGGSTEEAQENIASFVPNKIMEYINTGRTTNSVNFPNLTLPAHENAHRLIHIHRNMPGVLAHINNAFADHNINILGQYLKTNDDIGYSITDIDKAYNSEVIKDLKRIEGTIKFRVLY